VALTRNVDPEVAKARSKIAVAVRLGNEEAAEQYRQELTDARILLAAQAVAARLPELSPEKREQVRALLGGA